VSRPPVIPKHALGQHFLVDLNILRVIERLSELGPDDVVLEIGPGLGVLTTFLADRVALVHAVEIDRSLGAQLTEALEGRTNVRVLFADATRLDPAALAPPPTKLVSNLPYNVAAPVVVESLQALPTVGLWCVMVQREVGERFFADPGTKAYGAVSVLIQLSAERTGFQAVPRTVFRPKPRVDSVLLAFRRIEQPDNFGWVKQVVQAGFAHRRKTLPNSVELAGLASRNRAAAALEALGHDPATRAEALAPDELASLAELLT
jgi:16S rRNA (adenine1518-N6/adenine1519-N6)-dimethyltransferase